MNGKVIISVFIVVIIAVFAYYYTTLPQTSSSVTNEISREAQQAIEDTHELKIVTGTIVEISNEDLMIRTDEGILTIKKSEATKYAVLSNDVNTQMHENELQQNDEATIVVGVNSENEMTAISVSVVR